VNKNWNQKTIDLILDENTWMSGNGNIPIIHFCIEELYLYGVDPTTLKTPFNFDIFKQFNPSESEFYRMRILIHIYNACFIFYKHQPLLSHPDMTFDIELCEFIYKSASQMASTLTYMLTLTLKDKITEEDYNSAVAKVDDYQKARSKGGLAKAETEAKEIARKRAVELKKINPHLKKVDLVTKIILEMEQDKEKFNLKREVPSFDTMMKWLTNLPKN
jgi:hypothetical protein